MVEKAEWIWQDGRFVPWDEAKVHVLTHALHYGFSAFEGIRSYELADGNTAVFRLEEHLKRLYDSCKIIGLEVPVSFEELKAIHFEILSKNRLTGAYIRPIVFLGYGAMGLYAMDNPVSVVVAAFPWGAYLGDDGLANGIRAKVSSFGRNHLNSVMGKAKISGHYVNNILAKVEVMNLGYEEAIMLDTQGFVAEGSGENLFLIRHKVLYTPPIATVLEGITRNSVMTIAEDLGYQVIERTISRDELYIADELFVTGTAAEVTPVREVDDRPVGTGRPGSVTKAIQEKFFAISRGEADDYKSWLCMLPG